MLNIFGIDVNKWVMYAIGIILGACIAGGVYLYWKHDITSAAQTQFNNAQLEKTIQEQNDYINKTKAINAAQEKTLNDLAAQNSQLTDKLKDVNDYLGSSDAMKDDRPSSKVLKTTIQKLRAIK
ncbi:MAG: hypothetical protein ACXV2C_00365 [Candidatus Bathyarchaeia archaeon]